MDGIHMEYLSVRPAAEAFRGRLRLDRQRRQLRIADTHRADRQAFRSQQKLIGGQHQWPVHHGDFPFVQMVSYNDPRLQLVIQLHLVALGPDSFDCRIAVTTHLRLHRFAVELHRRFTAPGRDPRLENERFL